MHNALTNNYFVVSVRLWEGVGEGLTKHRMHAYLPVWCPLRLWAPGL